MKDSAATMVAMMWSDGEISPVRPVGARQQESAVNLKPALTCERHEQVQEGHSACDARSQWGERERASLRLPSLPKIAGTIARRKYVAGSTRRFAG